MVPLVWQVGAFEVLTEKAQRRMRFAAAQLWWGPGSCCGLSISWLFCKEVGGLKEVCGVACCVVGMGVRHGRRPAEGLGCGDGGSEAVLVMKLPRASGLAWRVGLKGCGQAKAE